MQSTKSGGPLAGAWAVTQRLGHEGYRTLTADVLEAVDRIVAGVADIPALSLVATPDSTLIAFSCDETCDPFTICDELATAKWYVQPQMAFAGHPATVHLSVSAATLSGVDDFLAALRAAVERAVAAGPVQVDPDVVAFIEALDPTALTDADFDGLLAASGLLGGAGTEGRADAAGVEGGPDGSASLQLPSRMAEINALLDVAAPAMREALLIAFLDRLQRP
ncbi:hypothetical protein [Nocardioides alcanivorans]|uniref:hypothetical protein n=1 Tax=Nocardioides alcanivorans TaxID=2897352 RepID=UPI001F2E3C86|nr:hypothetical protein [Nocardioides alcanivorans]